VEGEVVDEVDCENEASYEVEGEKALGGMMMGEDELEELSGCEDEG